MIFSWRPWSEWLVVYDAIGKVVGRRVRLAMVRLAPWLCVDVVMRFGTMTLWQKSENNIAYDHTFVGHVATRRVISSSEFIRELQPSPQVHETGQGIMRRRRSDVIAIGAFFSGCSRDVSELINSADGSVTMAQLASVAQGHGVAGAVASGSLTITYSDLSEEEYTDPDAIIRSPGSAHRHID